MTDILNFINNNYQESVSGQWIENVDPSTGTEYSRITSSIDQDVKIAVEAATKAFDSWSSMPVEKRSQIMHRIADLITENLDELSHAESVDNGKPLSLARTVDIPRASSNFRFYANTIIAYDSKAHEMGNSAINYTIRQPLGVVGCISPWNLPLYLFTWKIAPALATGNTVVAKPSEVTPMTAFMLGKICKEAGLPAGVLNIIQGHGYKAGAAIVNHPKVKAISFTGGTKTGASIAAQAAPKFKKLSLELGGKNPNIIFSDCNFDRMIRNTVKSSFANQGQICLCGSRILVEEEIYDKFMDAFVMATKKLIVGDPLNQDTNLGAVVSKSHFAKIMEYISLAKESGATIHTGGQRIILNGRCKDGYFIAPTIISGLDINHACNQEEIFGPVVTVMPFKTEEEAISLANGVKYGLSCTIWTESLNKSHRVAKKVEAGIVWINTWLKRDLRTPFGGIKSSGVGREGGREALDFFTEQKNICINYE